MNEKIEFYRANGEQEISALFCLEGDELKKADFSEPDLSHIPEEITPSETLGHAQFDPTGADEYLDNHYTKVNHRLVRRWRATGKLAILNKSDN